MSWKDKRLGVLNIGIYESIVNGGDWFQSPPLTVTKANWVSFLLHWKTMWSQYTWCVDALREPFFQILLPNSLYLILQWTGFAWQKCSLTIAQIWPKWHRWRDKVSRCKVADKSLFFLFAFFASDVLTVQSLTYKNVNKHWNKHKKCFLGDNKSVGPTAIFFYLGFLWKARG